MSNFIEIEIDWIGSLYDPRCDEFITKLENYLSIAKLGATYLLQAKNMCHDYHKSWLDGISNLFLWEEMARHFQRLSILLNSISNSKSKWIFLSGDDCLGSWWELALACHGRVWGNPYSKIGFPEVYIDLFPPIASDSIKRFYSYKSLTDVKKNAILHAKDAYQLDLISLVFPEKAWITFGGIDFLYPWILRLQVNPHKIKMQLKDEILSDESSEAFTFDSRANHMVRRKQIAASHLEFGFGLLKDKTHVTRAASLNLIRCGGVSRLFFEDYRSWISRRISRYEMGSHDKWWKKITGKILVDVSHGLPPQAIIDLLISRNIHLIFISKSELELKDAIETIFSRSKRVGLERFEIMNSWKGRLDWIVGNVNQSNNLWMSFKENDVIEFGIGSLVLANFYRLSGNSGTSNIGWAEILKVKTLEVEVDSQNSLNQIVEISEILTNGVLKVECWSFEISLSVVLRFCLISEMLELASSGLWPELYEQCKLLGLAGWGFASNGQSWEGLLRSYSKNRELIQAVDSLGGNGGYFRTPFSFNELRARSPKVGHISRLEISSARLSRYFEACATKYVSKLLDCKIVSSKSMADLFVTLAWGYPGKSPVPSELIFEFGVDRVTSWGQRSLDQGGL